MKGKFSKRVLLWLIVSVISLSALGVGLYFIFRKEDKPTPPSGWEYSQAQKDFLDSLDKNVAEEEGGEFIITEKPDNDYPVLERFTGGYYIFRNEGTEKQIIVIPADPNIPGSEPQVVVIGDGSFTYDNVAAINSNYAVVTKTDGGVLLSALVNLKTGNIIFDYDSIYGTYTFTLHTNVVGAVTDFYTIVSKDVTTINSTVGAYHTVVFYLNVNTAFVVQKLADSTQKLNFNPTCVFKHPFTGNGVTFNSGIITISTVNKFITVKVNAGTYTLISELENKFTTVPVPGGAQTEINVQEQVYYVNEVYSSVRINDRYNFVIKQTYNQTYKRYEMSYYIQDNQTGNLTKYDQSGYTYKIINARINEKGYIIIERTNPNVYPNAVSYLYYDANMNFVVQNDAAYGIIESKFGNNFVTDTGYILKPDGSLFTINGKTYRLTFPVFNEGVAVVTDGSQYAYIDENYNFIISTENTDYYFATHFINDRALIRELFTTFEDDDGEYTPIVTSKYYIINKQNQMGITILNYCDEFNDFIMHGLGIYVTKLSGFYSIYNYNGALVHASAQNVTSVVMSWISSSLVKVEIPGKTFIINSVAPNYEIDDSFTGEDLGDSETGEGGEDDGGIIEGASFAGVDAEAESGGFSGDDPIFENVGETDVVQSGRDYPTISQSIKLNVYVYIDGDCQNICSNANTWRPEGEYESGFTKYSGVTGLYLTATWEYKYVGYAYRYVVTFVGDFKGYNFSRMEVLYRDFGYGWTNGNHLFGSANTQKLKEFNKQYLVDEGLLYSSNTINFYNYYTDNSGPYEPKGNDQGGTDKNLWIDLFLTTPNYTLKCYDGTTNAAASISFAYPNNIPAFSNSNLTFCGFIGSSRSSTSNASSFIFSSTGVLQNMSYFKPSSGTVYIYALWSKSITYNFIEDNVYSGGKTSTQTYYFAQTDSQSLTVAFMSATLAANYLRSGWSTTSGGTAVSGSVSLTGRGARSSLNLNYSTLYAVYTSSIVTSVETSGMGTITAGGYKAYSGTGDIKITPSNFSYRISRIEIKNKTTAGTYTQYFTFTSGTGHVDLGTKSAGTNTRLDTSSRNSLSVTITKPANYMDECTVKITNLSQSYEIKAYFIEKEKVELTLTGINGLYASYNVSEEGGVTTLNPSATNSIGISITPGRSFTISMVDYSNNASHSYYIQSVSFKRGTVSTNTIFTSVWSSSSGSVTGSSVPSATGVSVVRNSNVLSSVTISGITTDCILELSLVTKTFDVVVNSSKKTTLNWGQDFESENDNSFLLGYSAGASGDTAGYNYLNKVDIYVNNVPGTLGTKIVSFGYDINLSDSTKFPDYIYKKITTHLNTSVIFAKDIDISLYSDYVIPRPDSVNELVYFTLKTTNIKQVTYITVENSLATSNVTFGHAAGSVSGTGSINAYRIVPGQPLTPFASGAALGLSEGFRAVFTPNSNASVKRIFVSGGGRQITIERNTDGSYRVINNQNFNTKLATFITSNELSGSGIRVTGGSFEIYNDKQNNFYIWLENVFVDVDVKVEYAYKLEFSMYKKQVSGLFEYSLTGLTSVSGTGGLLKKVINIRSISSDAFTEYDLSNNNPYNYYGSARYFKFNLDSAKNTMLKITVNGYEFVINGNHDSIQYGIRVQYNSATGDAEISYVDNVITSIRVDYEDAIQRVVVQAMGNGKTNLGNMDKLGITVTPGVGTGSGTTLTMDVGHTYMLTKDEAYTFTVKTPKGFKISFSGLAGLNTSVSTDDSHVVYTVIYTPEDINNKTLLITITPETHVVDIKDGSSVIGKVQFTHDSSVITGTTNINQTTYGAIYYKGFASKAGFILKDILSIGGVSVLGNTAKTYNNLKTAKVAPVTYININNIGSYSHGVFVPAGHVVAQFIEKEYEATFIQGGVTANKNDLKINAVALASNPIIIKYNSLLPVFTGVVPGYTFKGWKYTGSASEGDTNKDFLVSGGNCGLFDRNIIPDSNGNVRITLTAIFEANTYTVEYYDKAGNPIDSSVIGNFFRTVVYNSSLTLPGSISVTGYTHTKWALGSVDSGTVYLPNASVASWLIVPDEGTVFKFYAVYEANIYNVKVNLNLTKTDLSIAELRALLEGLSVSDQGVVNATIKYNEEYLSGLKYSATITNLLSYIINGLQKDNTIGYEFRGFATEQGATSVNILNDTKHQVDNSNLTLYSVWRVYAFNVKFAKGTLPEGETGDLRVTSNGITSGSFNVNFGTNGIAISGYSASNRFVMNSSNLKLHVSGITIVGDGRILFSWNPVTGKIEKNVGQSSLNNDGTGAGITYLDSAVASDTVSAELRLFINSSLVKYLKSNNSGEHTTELEIVVDFGMKNYNVNFDATTLDLDSVVAQDKDYYNLTENQANALKTSLQNAFNNIRNNFTGIAPLTLNHGTSIVNIMFLDSEIINSSSVVCAVNDITTEITVSVTVGNKNYIFTFSGLNVGQTSKGINETIPGVTAPTMVTAKFTVANERNGVTVEFYMWQNEGTSGGRYVLQSFTYIGVNGMIGKMPRIADSNWPENYYHFGWVVDNESVPTAYYTSGGVDNYGVLYADNDGISANGGNYKTIDGVKIMKVYAVYSEEILDVNIEPGGTLNYVVQKPDLLKSDASLEYHRYSVSDVILVKITNYANYTARIGAGCTYVEALYNTGTGGDLADPNFTVITDTSDLAAGYYAIILLNKNEPHENFIIYDASAVTEYIPG